MAAPTFVAEYETSWASNPASITQSVTTEPGDVLVLLAGTSNGGGTLNTPTDNGPGLTWTLRQSVHVSTSWSDAYVWTATASSSATFDVTVTKTGGSPVWGFNVLRYSGSDGIGASSKANVSANSSTGVSLNITTTGANSAVAWLNADWDTLSGASRAYRSVNGSGPTERTYDLNAFYTVYAATHADVGTAGAKTVGMTAPLGQKYSIVAVEILGGALNSGTFAAFLPKVTGALTGVSANPATLSAAVPKITGSLTGTARNPATLTATLPEAAGTLAGGSINPATIDGTLPAADGELVGTSANPATLTGLLPAVAGMIGETGTVFGTLDAELPKATGSIEGASSNSGTLDGQLPASVGLLIGTSVNSGELNGLLPVVSAEMAGTIVNPATLNAALPATTGQITDRALRDLRIIGTTVPTLAWQTNGPTVAWQTGAPATDPVGTTAPVLTWTAAADLSAAWQTTPVDRQHSTTTTAPTSKWATTGPGN